MRRARHRWSGRWVVAALAALLALSGTGAGNPGSPLQNARVTITDVNCTDGGNPVKRTFTTDAAGGLADPGLPAGLYDVCVDDGTRQVTTPGVDLLTFNDLADFEDGESLTAYVGGGTTGTCP